MWWRRLAEVQTEHQNEEERGLSDFERRMVVGARRAGLSISKTADLTGIFTHNHLYGLQRMVRKIENIQWAAIVGRKWFRGEWADWLEMIERQRLLNNHSLQPRYADYHLWGAQHIEPWSRLATAAEDQTVPLLSAKNRKRRLQFAQAHQNWTTEDWKNVAWSDESRFLPWHSDGRIRIWRKKHESMDPSCLVSTVQGGGGVIMVWEIFLGTLWDP